MRTGLGLLGAALLLWPALAGAQTPPLFFDPTPGIPGQEAPLPLPPAEAAPGSPVPEAPSPEAPLFPIAPLPSPVEERPAAPGTLPQGTAPAPATPQEGTASPEAAEDRAGSGLPAPTPFALSLEAQLARAAALARAQRYPEAVAAYRGILAENPYAIAAHIALGRLYVDRSPELAAEHIELAVRARPGSADVAYLEGRLREGQQDWDGAVAAYRRAIRLDPRAYDANARLRLVMGRLAARKSDVERASEAFWARPSLASLTLFGRFLLNQPDPHRALEELRRVQAERPDLPETALWLARVLNRLGRRAEEREAYRGYLEQAPDSQGVRLLLTQRQQEAGLYRAAEQTLRPLIDILERAPERLDAQTRGRIALLRSANALAADDMEGAVHLLRQAAELSVDEEELDGAYRRAVALHPQRAVLRLAQGGWLLSVDRPDDAVEALLAAGRVEPPAAPEAISRLQRLNLRGEAATHRDIALGELALQTGELERARALFAAVPATDPRQGRAALGLGLVYRAQGNTDQAIAAFTRYVFSYRERAQMAFARGTLFWELGQKELALQVWQEEPGLIEDYPEIQQRLADYLEQTGRPDLERQVREKIADTLPEDHGNRLRLGQLLLETGDPAAAILVWERLREERQSDGALLLRLARAYLVLDRKDDATELLLQARERGGLPDDLARLLARSLFGGGRYAEALPLVWHFYERDAADPLPRELLPTLARHLDVRKEVLLAAADLAEQQNTLADAAGLLERALEQDADNHVLRRHLAGLYIRLERPEDAARAMPNTAGPEGWNDTGRLHLQAEIERELGRKPALVETLADLTRLEPDNLALWQEQATLLEALGRRAELLPVLEQLERLQPEDGALPLRRAGLLLELGRLRDAAVLLVQLAAQRPDDPEPEWQLAQLSLRQGRAKDAETHLEAALQRDPAHQQAREQLISLLLKARRWKDLTPHLEHWLVDHPEDSLSRANLVTAYLQRFQKEKARPHFEALQQGDPNRARPLSIYFR